MVAKTLPLDYDIVVYSGTSYRRQLRWLPDGTLPQDFTGWDATMAFGQANTTATLLLTVGHGITLDPATGQITIELSPAQTTSLQGPGITYYVLDLTDPGGFVRRFLRGRVSVVVDVKKSP